MPSSLRPDPGSALDPASPGARRAHSLPSVAMPPDTEQQHKTLPPPWDRIFSLGTRLFVWALLVAILYILRPFFLLIFLTFVFAYVQAHGVDGLQHRMRNRPLRVTIVALVFLGSIGATVTWLAPAVREQAGTLLENYPTYIQKADESVNSWLRQSFPEVWKSVVRTAAPPPGDPSTPSPEPALIKDLVDSLVGLGSESETKHSPETFKKVLDVGSSLFGYLSAFLLSLLFSFLIVLDLPKLKRGVTGLAATRIGFIYEEVSENIATFGKVMGRALEAQLFIAIVNTILTAIGMWFLGLPNLLVLSTIVFVCSFIPVAGVFISSTPMCLIALSTGDFYKMVMTIVMVLIVHAIETYILNPRIYGHHMRMNPVFVLIVLTVCGKLFGVWGLVLGIPIVNYVFRHAIRHPADRPADV
jgi:predicted PurR-regulated permease PerM